MPAFERMYQEYSDKGVMFVGVAVSDDPANAKAFADEIGVTYPIGADFAGVDIDQGVVGRASPVGSPGSTDRRACRPRSLSTGKA